LCGGLARAFPTSLARVAKNGESVDEQRAVAKAAASELNFFIPRDAARKQYRLIEL
jgi:hypothetical protein